MRQNPSFLRIWTHLLKKSRMEDSIFCAVSISTNQIFAIGSNQMLAYEYGGLQGWTSPAVYRSRTDSPLCFQTLVPTPKMFGLTLLLLSYF